eukprot:gnl/TRDRNA2_/TRDRNA2_126777_c0_seq1.p1 gnl/TRDRNA2_/TRDRNA2_126777_c0~~gnl/TRDRNA2_/TRDRNA2_126777_c0_seq1.p1  ORF type:complete len:106 (+),score=2.89 gnl/TRDRNA2_/TRDRNA2_126777_c0_seq1:178-495(+)
MRRMRLNARAAFATLCGPDLAVLQGSASHTERIAASSCQCTFACCHHKMDISCELGPCSGSMTIVQAAPTAAECIIALTLGDRPMPDRSCARNCQRILSADEEIA